MMEKDFDALELQLVGLEEDHGIRGAYNPETTKVLEFRDSPDRVEHAIRSGTLERLRDENRALSQRITELEGRAVASEGTVALVPREALVTLEADVKALKAAVKQKETMLKRISQVRRVHSLPGPYGHSLIRFSSRIQAVAEKTEDMRIAISKLLGFQLAFLDSGRIRVTSVYAPSKNRSLAFDPWPGGPMAYKLVSAADEKAMRSNDVRQSINFWLDNRSSLPGFMASLTSSSFFLSFPGSRD
jgi:mitotic spindle assembly checkpoint protein MAD1